MLNIAKLEADLKNKDIRAQFKLEPLRQLAKQVVQYQDFSTSKAIAKMNIGAYKEWTARQYFQDGRKYIKTGRKVRNGKNPPNLYNYIDEFLEQKLQPLTPKDNEKAKVQLSTPKYEPQKIEVPVVRKQPTPKQNNDKYGVLINNSVKIYKTIEQCKAYQDACIDFGKNEIKLVRVKIEDLLND